MEMLPNADFPDMGERFGPFWWRYNLSFAGKLMENTSPWELRWYGITIGNIGIGFMIRVRRPIHWW